MPIRTEQQRAASRSNGAKSHGPTSAEGKARSAMNAFRHGILSKTILVGAESKKNFDKVVEIHTARFGDLDGVEFGMIEDMVSCYWHRVRLRAIEQVWLQENVAARRGGNELQKIAHGFAELVISDKYRLLRRYEKDFHRTYKSSLDTLLKLKKIRDNETNPSPGPEILPPMPAAPSEPAPQPAPGAAPEPSGLSLVNRAPDPAPSASPENETNPSPAPTDVQTPEPTAPPAPEPQAALPKRTQARPHTAAQTPEPTTPTAPESQSALPKRTQALPHTAAQTPEPTAPTAPESQAALPKRTQARPHTAAQTLEPTAQTAPESQAALPKRTQARPHTAAQTPEPTGPTALESQSALPKRTQARPRTAATAHRHLRRARHYGRLTPPRYRDLHRAAFLPARRAVRHE